MKTAFLFISTSSSQLCPEEANKKICLDGCAQELLVCVSQCDDEECAALCGRAEIECGNDCPCEVGIHFYNYQNSSFQIANFQPFLVVKD